MDCSRSVSDDDNDAAFDDSCCLLEACPLAMPMLPRPEAAVMAVAFGLAGLAWGLIDGFLLVLAVGDAILANGLSLRYPIGISE